MASHVTSFSLHEMISTINRSLPPEKHITLTTIVAYYGNIKKVSRLIDEKLNHLLSCDNYKEFLHGPFFETTPINFFVCRYVLVMSKDISFTSVGVTHLDSEYFSKLTVLLWLDKNDFVEKSSRDLGAEPILIGSQVRTVGKVKDILCDPFATTTKQKRNTNDMPKVNKTFLRNLLQKTVNLNPSNVFLYPNGDRALLQQSSSNIQLRQYFHNLASSENDPSKINNNKLGLENLNVGEKAEREEVAKKSHEHEMIDANTAPSNVTSVEPSNKVLDIFFSDNEETRNILKLFPAPRNVLHNVYDEICRETKQKILKPTPTYKSVKESKKSTWICTYQVQWPQEIKFMGKSSKKSVASHKAALAALNWLMSNKKIMKTGTPVIYEKSEITKLSNKTVPVLSLDETTIKYMKNIVEIHQKEIVPHIIKSKLEADEDEGSGLEGAIKEPDDVDLKQVKRQHYIGLQQYLAKEQVDLPISPYKDHFMKLLQENQILIVKGEPGCGKSTRIPQYVLEAWAKEEGLLQKPGRIVVTQPRRIAAISLAERVSSERGEGVGNIVGYQVRLRSNFRPQSGRILYCTTGILLRHLQSDPRLSNFTHIILDEAHERDVNTDLLINLLRDTTKTNPNLKLIVMSATIDTGMFSEFFGGAPIMEIPGFTYPVKQHFLDSCKIDLKNTVKMCEGQVPAVVHDDILRVIRYIHNNKQEGAILCFLPGWEDISKIQKMIPEGRDLAVYCLHSRLQDSEQWKIFSRPPPGVRKIILATNIAETSVTIDDVVYVIDAGIQKEQRFDIAKGVNCLDNHWISKASVNQRKGRAGRVQPGESYHMYPRSKYEAFSEYTLPEIVRTSLTKIILDSKVFSNNMNALEFMGKLPTPPEESAVKKAVEELKDLELLDNEENLTTLGKTIANFQLEPKLSKAMVNAVIFKCVTPVVDIVTLFSAETEVFVSGLINKSEVKDVKRQFSKNSDHLAMMRLFEKWLEYAEEDDKFTLRKFCSDANLANHKMQTLQKLRNIHFDYLYNGLYDVMPIADDYSDNEELVKAVLYSGVGTVLKHRNWDVVKQKIKNNVHVFLTRNNHKATITPESVNHKKTKFSSNFLLYINETRSNIRRTTLVRECSLIPKISVLLFSNKNFQIQEVDQKDASENIPSEDQVKLVIENTNIELLCDRAQAQELVKCKDAIMAGYRYYVRQLTDVGTPNSEVNNAWDGILALVNAILLRHNV